MERSPAKRRARDLRRYYDLTIEQYEAMVEAQHSRCAVCGKETAKLVVDHDHETGKVRSLLCDNCNLAIGHLKESADTADAVAHYLRRQPRKGV